MHNLKAVAMPGVVKAKPGRINTKKSAPISNRVYMSPQGRFYYAEAVFFSRAKSNCFSVLWLALIFTIIPVAL